MGADGQTLTRLRFEVADDGIGMSPDQLARIFQPFEQVAESERREGGTGLGLAISQQLVHLMGGHIAVSSEPNKGSLFWFELSLPVTTSKPAMAPVARAIIGYEGRRRRLLIVDDVAHNRAMLMDILQALGFNVADARNGQECLLLLDSFKPDLVVMDVMMPVMGGHEATRRMRQMPEWAAIPIITITASASRDDELKCYASGASAFLAKPVDHDLLLAAIGKQLSLRWISEQSVLESHEPDSTDSPALVIPPAPEMEALTHLARLGNMQKIWERADYLQQLDPAYAPFAVRLRTMAHGYQSKALAAFVARYRKGAEGSPLVQPPA